MSKVAVDPRIKKLEARFDAAAKARESLDAEWLLDAAFFVGKHYSDYNTKQGLHTIERKKGQEESPRPVANKIYHFVMDTYAMSKDAEADVEVLPTSGDFMDMNDARIATAWCRYTGSPAVCDWKTRRNGALFWVALCGEGWNKWTITEDKKLRIEACSPLDIYLPPSTSTYLDAPWIIHVKGMDPDEVYEVFGRDLPASDVDRQDALKSTVLREIGMVSGAPTVTVKELWELPGRRHPAGRRIVWAGNTVLVDEPFPYAHHMLPFTQIGHSPVPGTPHFTSGTRAMRPLNMELNQYHAQKINSRKRFTNFKWFLDATMRETMQELPDDSDAQVLIGDSRNGQVKPEILQAQVWPDSQDGEWLVEEMRDAVGIHAASAGEAPGRVDSASGIEKLQEGDRARLSEVEDTLDTAVGRGFAQLIELAREFVDEEQIVPVYAAGSAPAVHAFKTDRFPKKPILRVVKGGGLPKNAAARRAEIIAWWTAGLLGENPRKALELLELPTDLNLTGDERDIMEAQCENLLMMRGLSVTAQKWQNHELHRQIHNEWRKSAEFVTATEETWTQAEFHMDDHDRAEMEEIQEEAERQARITAVAEQVTPPPEPVPGEEGAPPEAPVGGDPTAQQPEGQAAQTGPPNA